ncbi:hypothetical protein MMC09_006673 [Bachmanniomyces sp. S44760]|nr:hypothetical protein [Bachmanniomyces sp. S44760]
MSNNPGSAVGQVAGFSQQGQVDWVQMSNSLFSTSSQVLQRFADAGIQPMTHQAGLAIATKFQLSEKGNQRVRDALSSLRPYYGFESVLWFGFGHKSFLNILTERELGVKCAALCACLGETFGSNRAAQLLQALWKTNDFPEDFEPSRRQFGALVSGCSGLFLATPFADILQRMAGEYKDDDFSPIPVSPIASLDLAKAISAMFQASSGILKAIEVHGGRDIAFLGAIAYWLFDLRIWVERHDGSVLFSNCLTPEEAVVRLHYVNTDLRQSSLIQVSATTFALRSVEDLIVDDPVSSITFRIPWGSCLTELFGTEVADILDQAALLGKILGAIARINEAIATCEMDVGELSRAHFINFQPKGYGKPFIKNICALLPEFGTSSDFQEGAVYSLGQSVAENVIAIHALIEQLKTTCHCGYCKNLPTRYRSCNVAALLFLRYLGDIMAHVDSEPSIHPTCHGLRTAYDAQRRLWNIAKGTTYTWGRSHLGMAVGIPHASEPFQDIKISQPKGYVPFLLDYILGEVYRLFIGPVYNTEFAEKSEFDNTPQCTAVSRAGICIWLDALRSANDNPGSMSTVHVVRGQIMCKNRNYASVRDLSHSTEESSRNMPVVEFSTPGTLASPIPLTSRPSSKLRALATEREVDETIGFTYQVKSGYPSRYLQPGILTEELLVSSARFPCLKTTSCSENTSMPWYLRRTGWEFMDYGFGSNKEDFSFNDNDCALLSWMAHDPVSKLLAIEGSRLNSWYQLGRFDAFSVVLIRSEQCMACFEHYLQTSKDQLIWEQSIYTASKYDGEPLESEQLRSYIHII